MNDERTVIYCDLMTDEDVEKLSAAMNEFLGCSDMEIPAKWAERKPAWAIEGRERREGEDPLAACILCMYHGNRSYRFISAYRCTAEDAIKVTPEVFLHFCMMTQYESWNIF